MKGVIYCFKGSVDIGSLEIAFFDRESWHIPYFFISPLLMPLFDVEPFVPMWSYFMASFDMPSWLMLPFDMESLPMLSAANALAAKNGRQAVRTRAGRDRKRVV